MVFSSLAFLFIFLTVHLAAYLLVPNRYKNAVLLVSSLIFYSWGGPRYLLLLMFETAASWLIALQVQRSGNDDVARKRWLVAEVVILLGLLGFFKYTGFVLGNFKALFALPFEVPNIVLPIGISFYTFQLISYVVDVYRGEVQAQTSYWKLLLYSSLFHQCIAGPIVRYQTVASSIEQRELTRSNIMAGTRRFTIGLAKKAVLANGCATAADALVAVGTGMVENQAVAGYWLGMLFYTLQLYLDFSAYSDMAIGLGRMIGFRYLENFDHPYESSSVREFWRRWHISLSSFFRDYVYIPLGGSRCSTPEFVRNTFVVWLLTGLWHGASWNFVLWGLYFFGFLMLERFVIRDRMPRPLGHVYAMLVVLVGWVLFRFEDFGELVRVLGGMVGIGASGLSSLQVHTVFMGNLFLLLFSIVASTSAGTRLRQWLQARAHESALGFRVFSVTEAVLPPALLVLSVISLAGASYNPFIYFQF